MVICGIKKEECYLQLEKFLGYIDLCYKVNCYFKEFSGGE